MDGVIDLDETDLSLAKTPPAFDSMGRMQELRKRPICTIWNRRYYLPNDIFHMLRIHRFSGASTARGRTGPRELFLPSDGFDATSPAHARRPERSGTQHRHLHILFADSHRAELERCLKRGVPCPPCDPNCEGHLAPNRSVTRTSSCRDWMAADWRAHWLHFVPI